MFYFYFLQYVDGMGKHHFGQCASKNAMETTSSRLSSMRREPTPECLAEEVEVSNSDKLKTS